MNYTIKLSYIAFSLGLLAIAAAFTDQLFEWPPLLSPYKAIIILGFFSFIFYYWSSPVNLNEFTLITGIASLFFLISIMSIVNYNISYRQIFVIASLISNYFLALFIIKQRIVYALSIFSFIFIICIIIWFSINYGLSFSVYDKIFDGASRNVVGAWVLTIGAAAIASAKIEHDKIPLWISIVVLVIATLFGTRSLILVAVALLAVVIFFRFGGFVLLISIIVGFLLVFLFKPFFIETIYFHTKFADAGFYSPRFLIWKEYVNQIQWYSLFLGFPLDNIDYIINYWSGNPHSSFISLFSYFGVWPFFLFLIAAHLYFKSIEWVSFACLLVVFVRASTDTLLFGRPMDLFFVLLFLMALGASNKKQKRYQAPHSPGP
jgi:hypothetical protein